MGRPPRIQIRAFHYHIIVRCNNREFLFQEDEDFSRYLSILHIVQKKHSFKLFNYELMNSHVHLFVQPSFQTPLSKTMHLINWKYSRDYNLRKNRKAHFWMQHYQCIPVESDRYALALMRYMNQNPIRAGMTKQVGEWKWSGSRFYLGEEKNSLLEPHISYLALSTNENQRRESYKKFVQTISPTENKLNFSQSNYIGSNGFGEKLKKFLCG